MPKSSRLRHATQPGPLLKQQQAKVVRERNSVDFGGHSPDEPMQTNFMEVRCCALIDSLYKLYAM